MSKTPASIVYFVINFNSAGPLMQQGCQAKPHNASVLVLLWPATYTCKHTFLLSKAVLLLSALWSANRETPSFSQTWFANWTSSIKFHVAEATRPHRGSPLHCFSQGWILSVRLLSPHTRCVMRHIIMVNTHHCPISQHWLKSSNLITFCPQITRLQALTNSHQHQIWYGYLSEMNINDHFHLFSYIFK